LPRKKGRPFDVVLLPEYGRIVDVVGRRMHQGLPWSGQLASSAALSKHCSYRYGDKRQQPKGNPESNARD